MGWWWHTTEDTVDKIDPDFLLRDTRIYLGAVARFLCARLLPLSAAGEARDLHDLLAQQQAEYGACFDLSPALTRAAELVRETERLDRWARERAPDAGQEEARLFNQTVTAVCRYLIPVNYTARGQFDHDPALTMPPVPLLSGLQELMGLPPDSDEARFLMVKLVRARNQVVYALELALDAVRRAKELGLE